MPSPSSSMLARTLAISIAGILCLFGLTYAEDCPQCFFNQTPPNTTGNGTAADGRPKLTVQIDSSWNVNNSGGSQTNTNASIWNGVTGCSSCTPPDGAAGMWNSAQGTSFGINYHIELNQTTQNPNIRIIRDDTISSATCANITLEPPGGPYVLRLPTSTASYDLWTIVEIIGHEIGHAIGLEDITNLTQCGLGSIMAPSVGSCANQGGRTVTSTDVNQSRKAMDSAASTTCEAQLNSPLKVSQAVPTPTPSPTPTPAEAGQTDCNDWLDNDGDGLTDCEDGGCHNSCPGGCNQAMTDICSALGAPFCVNGQCYTPILIDVLGDGLRLTNARDGILFNVLPGKLVRIAWTTPDSDDAWLTLDRNGNGLVDSGEEMFGNATPQPAPPPGIEKNGFLALAEFDKSANGGNSDGVINHSDAIFTSLRLWQDTNHNGVSEATELHTLSDLRLATLELTYKESKRIDQYGNQFRYRAKVKDQHGNQIGRWAWDVFLNMGP